MAFGTPQGQPARTMGSIFNLEFPQSVRVYDKYADSQKAVDFLADADFPVQNLCIVGTDLKQVERVLGRKTWGSVILQGVTSGVSMALLFALLAFIFFPQQNFLSLILIALVIGIGISVAMQALTYALSGGQRDFNSVTQTIATKYEILCEHKVAAQAREMLDTMPGERARHFDV